MQQYLIMEAPKNQPTTRYTTAVNLIVNKLKTDHFRQSPEITAVKNCPRGIQACPDNYTDNPVGAAENISTRVFSRDASHLGYPAKKPGLRCFHCTRNITI